MRPRARRGRSVGSKNDSRTDRVDVSADHRTLHVISAGRPAEGATVALSPFVEVKMHLLDVPADTEWSDLGGAINRVLDEVGDWVLLLRAGERVGTELAGEIERKVSPTPVAWAFRISRVVHYVDGPLYRPDRRIEGEIRLFHPRRCRFKPRGTSLALQTRGTVIRVPHPLVDVLFDSTESHRSACAEQGVARRPAARTAAFLHRVWRDRNRLTLRTFRYHWIESGWINDES